LWVDQEKMDKVEETESEWESSRSIAQQEGRRKGGGREDDNFNSLPSVPDDPTNTSTAIAGTYLGLCTGGRTRGRPVRYIEYYTMGKGIGMIRERR